MSVIRCIPRFGQQVIRQSLRPNAVSSQVRALQTTSVRQTFSRSDEELDPWPKPKEWPLRNHWVHAPQGPDELRRRAECFHYRANVKYSAKKMWYICMLVRGLPIDEAVKQLSFVPKKGAVILKEVLEEARELALSEYNFEHRSNMFVAAANCEHGLVIKGFRKHAFYRMGEVNYFHTHVLVHLVEGPAPKDYDLYKFTNRQKLEQYVDDLRRRNIKFSL